VSSTESLTAPASPSLSLSRGGRLALSIRRVTSAVADCVYANLIYITGSAEPVRLSDIAASRGPFAQRRLDLPREIRMTHAKFGVAR